MRLSDTGPSPSLRLPRNSQCLCGFHELIPELFGSSFHLLENLVVMLLIVVVSTWINVRSLFLEGEVDHARELVSGGCDRLLGAETCLHPPVEGPQSGLGTFEGLGRDSKSRRQSVRSSAVLPGLVLAVRDVRTRGDT